jgi:hypothetical protein
MENSAAINSPSPSDRSSGRWISNRQPVRTVLGGGDHGHPVAHEHVGNPSLARVGQAVAIRLFAAVQIGRTVPARRERATRVPARRRSRDTTAGF